MMRKFYVILLFSGVFAAVGYPWYFANLSGYEIGTYSVYKRQSGFKAVTVNLGVDQTPVRMFVDMTPVSGYYPVLTRTMLTLTASNSGKTVFASALDFVSTSTQSTNLQTTDMIFRDQAGDLAIAKSGAYTFVIGEGDVEGLSMKSVKLTLRANAQTPDLRVQPVGLAFIALGFLGLLRSWRRADNAQSESETNIIKPNVPDKPRWGRDAAGE